MSVLVEVLTVEEKIELSQLEERVERGLRAFCEAGLALRQIRDNRLYRESYDVFEDYCRDRWDLGKSYAYELIAAAEVQENLSGTPDAPQLTSVSQARPIAGLPPEQQVEVVQAAVAETGKLTAATVTAAAERLHPKFQPEQQVFVADAEHPQYQQPVKVVEAQGDIVLCEVPDSPRPVPFFASELTPTLTNETSSVLSPQSSLKTRPQHTIEGLEVMLMVERERSAVLEDLLRRIVGSCQTASIQALPASMLPLIREAESLL
ncbi:hypothetical protein H6F43_03060 [Leptolyngbya sp. FACHB-36]|uniref:hypothetical protein n=1 Tax=Leptolyngbya sp. FACHB-36 TaxID=2692808 RepID=UPI001680A9EC|nr:hypothetical protein [Leptolyngbya sp. FACHB-36]MBD2019163.1 hypothetical protein [Leptolyngbya sp. FACHB-36]